MYPFSIPGITDMGTDQYRTVRIALDENADESTIRSLVNDIPTLTRVVFFDKDYASPSDPGAYVEFIRIDNQYVIKRANHGWSSNFEVLQREELEKYLQRCAGIHRKNAEGFEPILITKITEMKFAEKLNSDFIESIKRGDKTAWILKIFSILILVLLFAWLCLAYYR